jgi:hypothetical protein
MDDITYNRYLKEFDPQLFQKKKKAMVPPKGW